MPLHSLLRHFWIRYICQEVSYVYIKTHRRWQCQACDAEQGEMGDENRGGTLDQEQGGEWRDEIFMGEIESGTALSVPHYSIMHNRQYMTWFLFHPQMVLPTEGYTTDTSFCPLYNNCLFRLTESVYLPQIMLDAIKWAVHVAFFPLRGGRYNRSEQRTSCDREKDELAPLRLDWRCSYFGLFLFQNSGRQEQVEPRTRARKKCFFVCLLFFKQLYEANSELNEAV